MIIGPKFWGYNESIARAFEQLGFETRVIGFVELYKLHNHVKYYFKSNRLESMQNKEYVNKKIIEMYNEFRPDVVFVIKGTILYESTLKMLGGSIKVLWMMDSIFIPSYKSIYELKDHFDFIFLFEKSDLDKIEESREKFFFLPLAVDPEIYYPKLNNDQDIDIFFVGSLADYRLDILYALCEDFKGYNLKFYGKRNWTFNKPYKYFFNHNIFPNRTLSPSEVNDYYNRSKVCINILENLFPYGVNQRFYEITGACAHQVVNNNPLISEMFNADEVYSYSDYAEMKESIRKILEYKEYPKTETAYNKIILKHTFSNRMSSVINTINYK